MKITKTISALFFSVVFGIGLAACGDLQSQYDACLDDPSACETTSDDALSAASAAAADAAAGNSCSATSLDGSASCQVTCPSWERALCSSTKTAASCSCSAATPPPKEIGPVPVGGN